MSADNSTETHDLPHSVLTKITETNRDVAEGELDRQQRRALAGVKMQQEYLQASLFELNTRTKITKTNQV